MKQRIYLLCLAFLLVGALSAQEYVVYKASAKVMLQTPQGQRAVKPGDKLTGESVVTIPYEGMLQIVNQDSQERYIIKTTGSGKVVAMMKDKRNSVSKLTQQYVDYIISQVVDGGKSMMARHSDVATVTRELQKTEEPDEWDLDKEFADFSEKTEKEFADFRDEVNAEYAEFMKNGWKNFDPEPAIKRPKDEHVAPVITKRTDQAPPATNSFFRKHKNVVEVQQPKTQPTPMAPIKEQEVVKEDYVTATLWGTEFKVRFSPKLKFKLADTSPTVLSDTWKLLAQKEYNNVIRDCMDLRFEKHLGDWAYLQMLKSITIACLGEGNEATLLMAYIYCQSGYRMRLCREGSKLFMLFGSEHYIYDKDYFSINGEFYYPFEFDAHSMSICNVPYPDEQSMSLLMSEQQQLAFEPAKARSVHSKRFPDMDVDITVNQHLIDFYSKYPTSTINDDFMTRWAVYANTPMEPEVRDQLYPFLRDKIKGLSKKDAVERLLNWIQTGFEYKYDEEVWGQDRAFFAEESLFYPYCDCEDRSILLSRLIRDLVGLKCVLVYYPGHLAMATHFDEPVNGTYYTLGEERYYVCDPTIVGWGAPIGEPMEMFKDCTDVSLILLKNPE